jgi:intracellular sulfur oxidation DsrE/DsrF family protein
MKKLIGLFSVAILLSVNTIAQSIPSVVNPKKYKIVIQLTNGDTAVHRATVKQIFNALTAAPNSKIEVVCHNNGISFLQTAKTFQGENIKALKAKGVQFMACENTLRERKIDKSEIVSEAGFVPAGIIEVVDKQTKGWAYIKAGF